MSYKNVDSRNKQVRILKKYKCSLLFLGEKRQKKTFLAGNRTGEPLHTTQTQHASAFNHTSSVLRYTHKIFQVYHSSYDITSRNNRFPVRTTL